MQISNSLVVASLAASATLFALTGCAPANEPQPGETTAHTPNATAPTATATAEPVQLLQCDELLTPAGDADLAEDNLTLSEFEFQTWDYPLLADFADSGIVCKWAGGGDVFVVVGQLAMDERAWSGTKTELQAQGFVEDAASGVPGYLNGPDGPDESYPLRGFVWQAGVLYYASHPGILQFVEPLQK